ncbi:MAG: RNA polymerase sigma factor [Phycisphaerales bacterium]
MPTGDRQPDDAANARDLQLVAVARAGDRAAMSTLLARYQDRLFGVCLGMAGNRDDAAELAQDTLVKLIRNLHQFDGKSLFSTWAIRVAMNVCLSHRRAAKLRRTVSLDGGPAFSDTQTDAASPDATLRGTLASDAGPAGDDREHSGPLGVELPAEHAAVSRALASLDMEQRSILILRDVRGLDYDQIAFVLDVPVGTVKSRLFRARAALRTAMMHLTSHPSGPMPSTT